MLRTTCCCVSPLARLTQSGLLAEGIMGLDLEEVILIIEDKYGIKIPDMLPSLITVQDLSDLVLLLVQEQKHISLESQVILEDVVKIVTEKSSRWRRKPVTPDAKLLEVLSM